MDPLSISAGIAGLVTLAGIVFGATFKYVNGVKDAPKEIKTLSNEKDVRSENTGHKISHRLRWPFSKSEVKDLVSQLEEHKSTLSLALEADNMLQILKVLGKQDQLSEDLQEVGSDIRAVGEVVTRLLMNS